MIFYNKLTLGDLIDIMVNTALSIGTHIHYEVGVNGVPVNPRMFLP